MFECVIIKVFTTVAFIKYFYHNTFKQRFIVGLIPFDLCQYMFLFYSAMMKATKASTLYIVATNNKRSVRRKY